MRLQVRHIGAGCCWVFTARPSDGTWPVLLGTLHCAPAGVARAVAGFIASSTGRAVTGHPLRRCPHVQMVEDPQSMN